MGHHQASFHASSIEFSERSKVVCWRAGLSRGGTTWGHMVTWASPAMLSLEAWHGAQLQQIHLGFVNYRSELYNQLVYISYTYLQAQSAFRSRGPGEGPRYLVVRNAFLPVSNRGRVTDRVHEEFQTPTRNSSGGRISCRMSCVRVICHFQESRSPVDTLASTHSLSLVLCYDAASEQSGRLECWKIYAAHPALRRPRD